MLGIAQSRIVVVECFRVASGPVLPPSAVAAASMIPVSGPGGKKVFSVPYFFPPSTPTVSSAPLPPPNYISLSKVKPRADRVAKFVLCARVARNGIIVSSSPLSLVGRHLAFTRELICARLVLTV